jgi:hypothetical protein
VASGAADEAGVVRGAGDRLADALRGLARWSVYPHEGDPRHLSIRRDDAGGDTLLRTSEGAGDQAVAAEFAWAVTECVEAFRAPGSSVRLGTDEVWLLYDLVCARVAQVDAAELATQTNCGGEPWRLLQRRLRQVLPAPAPVPNGGS